jgi:hypothetical protein
MFPLAVSIPTGGLSQEGAAGEPLCSLCGASVGGSILSSGAVGGAGVDGWLLPESKPAPTCFQFFYVFDRNLTSSHRCHVLKS